MSPERAIAILLAVSLAVVLALGGWLLWRARHAAPPPPPPEPTAAPSATPAPTPAGEIPEAARGYRLAGTVIGDVTYAILELPGGGNELVRPGQILRGIGQVVAIDEYRIVVAGDEGEFALPLAAAPTATPTRVIWRSEPPSSPAPTPPPDRSAFESSP